jgi:protein gp37/ParB-like chromosome segregation protein Spo0J
MLELHPLARLFPEMGPEDFRELMRSIETRGLEEPIVLYEGQVVDGRNRLRACLELGITPQTVVYQGDDPLGYVIAKNYARRHLTESQRALVAGRIANLNHGGDRKSRDVKNQSPNSDFEINEAATLLHVGRSSVLDARVVLASAAPDLVRAVERGEIAISAARSIATLPDRRQKEIALTKDKRQRAAKMKAAKEEARHMTEQRKAAAVPLVLTSKAADLKPAERVYLIDQWTRLPATERTAIIEAGFECRATMNDQPSDAIEWARRSLNTVTGCLHDCPYCYARDIAERMYPQKFKPAFHPSRLSAPQNETVPSEARTDPAYKNIFANSMSDLFGSWVPVDWIEATIEMARRNPEWNFLTLTKFPQRAADFQFPTNWWMGTTVDAQSRVDSAERAFAKIQCGTKWLSVEPLLQPLTFSRLDLFQWIVIGGASASKRTPAWQPQMDWIVDLHAAAKHAGVKIYYKTNCGPWDSLRDRQFPWSAHGQHVLPKSLRYIKGL